MRIWDQHAPACFHDRAAGRPSTSSLSHSAKGSAGTPGSFRPVVLWCAVLCAGAGGVPVGEELQLEAEVANEKAVLVHRMGGRTVVGHVGVVQDDTRERAMSGLLRPGSEPSLPPAGLKVVRATAGPTSEIAGAGDAGKAVLSVDVIVHCATLEAMAALATFLGALGVAHAEVVVVV
ncbi:hypothetical protein B484DRAFT_467295 [Ochromonadaceae sp. CCMP2298]|nr:hypothetical protein B484DRAFT_467295 [Ochromonadaceae sp. CCMP2298]